MPDDEVAMLTHGNAEALFRWHERPTLHACSDESEATHRQRRPAFVRAPAADDTMFVHAIVEPDP